MYWWKELLFVSSYKVCFLFQNFVSCSVSYNINWIVTQIGFFPGPHICSKALTGVGRGITSPFHGDFYFNFHLSWLMCKSWMLQRLENWSAEPYHFPWFVTSMTCRLLDTMEIGKLAQTVDPVGLPRFSLELRLRPVGLCTMNTEMLICGTLYKVTVTVAATSSIVYWLLPST